MTLSNESNPHRPGYQNSLLESFYTEGMDREVKNETGDTSGF
jgi:hypothetical protein